MQCSFGNQSIEIIRAEHFGSLECANDEGYSLELGATLRNALFINCESLYIQIVCQVLESALVRNLGGK